MIRIHKDTSTADAIADSIKLNLGDLLEDKKEIPLETTFKILIEANASLKDWIIDIIKSQISNKINDDFINEVFSYINDTTRKEFVDYRLNLIAESKKTKPYIVEVG